jgi:hypothetical protein
VKPDEFQKTWKCQVEVDIFEVDNLLFDFRKH